MRLVNLLILLLAIPPAILSSIQLFNTSLPVVSPIYDQVVSTATDKIEQVAHPRRAESASSDSNGGVPVRPVHIGIAGVSILIALLMFFGLFRRRAHA